MIDANAIQGRIGELCHQFRLPTMGAQSVSRFAAAGHGDALETLLEVLEQEAEDRRQRRIVRLRTASRLPAGKTWETFEYHRMPLALRQQLDHLAQGSFVERGVNVLAFGLPGNRQNPRPVRPGPPPSGSWPLRPLRPGLPPGAGTPGRQARSGPAPPAPQVGHLRLPPPGRPGLSAPGSRKAVAPLKVRQSLAGTYRRPCFHRRKAVAPLKVPDDGRPQYGTRLHVSIAERRWPH